MLWTSSRPRFYKTVFKKMVSFDLDLTLNLTCTSAQKLDTSLELVFLIFLRKIHTASFVKVNLFHCSFALKTILSTTQKERSEVKDLNLTQSNSITWVKLVITRQWIAITDTLSATKEFHFMQWPWFTCWGTYSRFPFLMFLRLRSLFSGTINPILY